ncbi:DUF6221 family protein [Streptomyces sp. NPDC055025]
MPDDLPQFLRDRLDEDYEAARRTLGTNVMARVLRGQPAPRWVPSPEGDAGIWDTDGTPRVKFVWARERDHIVRHDPARVLADVEAKRQIVDASAARCPVGCRVEHSYSGSCMLRSVGPAWEADGERWVHGENGEPTRPRHTAEWTLRLLALPYDGHPDYRQEWKP